MELGNFILALLGIILSIVSLVLTCRLGYIPYIPQISIYPSQENKQDLVKDLYLTIDNSGQTTVTDIHIQLSITTTKHPDEKAYQKLIEDEYDVDYVNVFQHDKIHNILLEAYLHKLENSLSVGTLPPTKIITQHYGKVSSEPFYNHFIYTRFDYFQHCKIVPNTNTPYPYIFDIYKRELPELYEILCIPLLIDEIAGEYIWEGLYFLKDQPDFFAGVYSQKWHNRIMSFLSELKEKDILSSTGLGYLCTLSKLLENLNTNFQKTQKDYEKMDNIKRYTRILLNAYEVIFNRGINFILPQEIIVNLEYINSISNKQEKKNFSIDMKKSLPKLLEN